MNSGDMEYKQFVRRRVRVALLGVVGVSLFLVLLGLKPWAKGLALGGLFSILNFILLSRALPNTVARRDKIGRSIASLWLVGRLALMAVPLYLAATSDVFNLPATAIGLFAVQAVLFLEPVIKRFVSKRGERR